MSESERSPARSRATRKPSSDKEKPRDSSGILGESGDGGNRTGVLEPQWKPGVRPVLRHYSATMAQRVAATRSGLDRLAGYADIVSPSRRSAPVRRRASGGPGLPGPPQAFW